MEITVKVDDSEGPFLMELLRRFTFVRDIVLNQSALADAHVDALWQEKAAKLFATKTDFIKWLALPNQTLNAAQPITLLNSEEGHQTVLTLLGRLEHGIMA